MRRAGKLDKPICELELRKNFNDVEEWRFRVAAAAGIPVAKVKAGKVSLHWTLLPSGRMRDTLVLEAVATYFPARGDTRTLCAPRQKLPVSTTM